MRNVPKKYRGLYIKAMNKTSRKAAIRSFCLECVCYQEKEAINCTDDGCPLWRYREHG